MVQLATVATVPAGSITPCELVGFIPPVVKITFPVTTIGCSSTRVAVTVVLTASEFTTTVALPEASKVTC